MADWAAYKAQIISDFLGRNTAIAKYEIDGKTVECRTPKDFRELIEFCDLMLASEAGDMDTFVQFGRPGSGI